jgi:hypothetical protein
MLPCALSGAPPPVRTLLRPLPLPPSLVEGSVPGMAARALVPPLWCVDHCDGFLRRRGAGLLHPVAGPGVRRVSTRSFVAPAGSLLRTRRTDGAFPPARYPSKAFSSSAAVPGRPGLLPPHRSLQRTDAGAPDLDRCEPDSPKSGLPPCFVSWAAKKAAVIARSGISSLARTSGCAAPAELRRPTRDRAGCSWVSWTLTRATQGFPWRRASCARRLSHLHEADQSAGPPLARAARPKPRCCRGTSLRLAPSVRAGADALRKATEIAPGTSRRPPPRGGVVARWKSSEGTSQRPSFLSSSVAKRVGSPRLPPLAGQRCFSADESVVTRRRCQRPSRRSFHGLIRPLRGMSPPIRSNGGLPLLRSHLRFRLSLCLLLSRDASTGRPVRCLYGRVAL